MASAAREMMSLRALLKEVCLPANNSIIFCDNSPVLFLAENAVATPRSKHIDIRYHFIRDVCAEKLLLFKWIPSASQLADILTKYLPRDPFQRCCAQLVVLDPQES